MSFDVTALNAFRNANLGGEKAIANLGQDDNVVKKNNYYGFIGKVFRGDNAKAANNAVRTELLKALGRTFNLAGAVTHGGRTTFTADFMDRLEQILGPAFRRGDFGIGADGTVGSGKPLTQRRIKAVNAAIGRYVAAENARLPAATAALRESAGALLGEHGDLDADELNGSVDMLVDYVGDDAGLMEILKDKRTLGNVLLTLRDGARGLRGEDGIKAKVDALRANLDELRQAADGDAALVNAGVRCLATLHGKAMPQGCIARIVALAKAANLDDVRGITAKSGMADLHKGLMQYSGAVERIRLESKAMHTFGGGAVFGDELSDMRRAIGHILLASCGPSTMRSIQRALTGDACGKLMNAYSSVAFDQDYEFPDDLSPAIKDEMVIQAKVYLDSVSSMKEIVDDAIGADGKVPMDSQRRNGVVVAFDNPIFDRIIPSLKTAAEMSIADKQNTIIGKYVSGDGQGGGVIREAMRRRIGDYRISDMESKIQIGMDRTVGSLLNWNIMATCRTAATQGVGNTDSMKGLNGDDGGLTEITIGGERLSRDSGEALDQIARFVSGDPKATYSGMDAQSKAKVHVVLSFISPKARTAAYDGTAIALGQNLNKMPFTGVFDEKSEKTRIDISFNNKGGLVVSLRYERPVRAILGDGELQKPEDEERPTNGRAITAGFTYTLARGRLDTISKLDFLKFDDTQARQIAQSDASQKMSMAVKSFGRDYIIPDENGKCEAIFKAELNG